MDIQKPRVTEFHVRMDCNGCVQKIRKALHGIQGICEVYPDIAQQKLTVIGWADPERIVKAIRKTRKTVTICSHLEPAAQPSDGGPAAQETPNPTPSEVPPPPPPPDEAAQQPEAAATPTGEPPKDQPPPDNPQPEPAPAPAPADANPNAGQQPLPQTSGQKDVGEVHVIHHHSPDYGPRYGYGYGYVHGGGPYSRPQYPVPNSQSNFYQNSQPFHHEPLPPQPALVTHSYNTYKPPPHVTEYEYVRSPPHVTEYEYVHSPPPYTNYSRIDHYNEDYYNNYHSNGGGSSSSSYNNNNNNGNGNGNGNITSIFSDENPNACRIM